MKKIIITGKFEGRILIWYGMDGQLVKLSFEEAQVIPVQKKWLLDNVPVFDNSLPFLVKVKNAKGELLFKLTEELEALTFDDFYAEYGYKEGKQKALSSWNKMTATEQMKAYQYISRYKTKLKTAGTAQAYPATYLNQKRWED